MKRIALSSLIIFSVTVALSQSLFYYQKGERVPLNENPLVRYVCLDKQMPEKEASIITRQLELFCWRVDTYDSTFRKYYINQNDLNNFLSVVSQYNSKVILHTPNYASVDTDSFYPVRQVLVKSSSNFSVEDLLTQLNVPFERVVQNPYNVKYYSIFLYSDDAISVSATLYETGHFDFAEPDFVFSCSLLGNEDNPLFSD